jgi:putative oxidoreductase
MRNLEKLKPLALLWLRVALGIIFFFYGHEKLFTATADSLKEFPQMGFPSYFVYISGILELFGALLLIAGLFTRVTALLLGIEMAIVLARVSLPRAGIYAVRGYQLPLALSGGSFALAALGAGLLSLDAFTFERAAARPARAKR